MHELSIVQSLVEQVVALADRHGAVSVSSISIEVGPLGNVIPELLETSFEAFRGVDPRLASARLEVRRVPLKLQCRWCGAEWEVPEPEACCPRCAGTDVLVLAGEDIMLRDVELELEEVHV